MKKKILLGIVIMAITTIAAWNVNIKSQTKGMSEISLSNVEALADEYFIISICCTTYPTPVVCFSINGSPAWSGYLCN